MAAMETDGGTDFLNIEGDLPDLQPEDKVEVTNLFISIGGQKPTDENGKNRFYATKVLKAIRVAAKWTGNSDSDVACCIDATTIQSWNPVVAQWKLPPYVMKGESLQTTLFQYVHDGFDKHIQVEREEYEAACGSLDGYLPSVSWEAYSPILGTGIRYFIQHWHCFPQLSRIQNFESAKTKLLKDCTSKYKPNNITKDLIHDAQHDYLMKALDALPTELDGNKAVFTDEKNDHALQVIDEYLRYVGFRYSVKNHQVSLTALQEYITKLPVDDEDRTEHLARFRKVRPRETPWYKEKMRELKEKSDKKVASEEKKAERVAKKQATEQKKLEKRIAIQNKALSGGGGGADSQKRKSKRKATKKNSNEEQEAIREFVKDKLHHIQYKAHSKEATPTFAEDAPVHHQGPKKIFKHFDIEGATISYVPPGAIFCLGLKQRFNNMAFLLGLMDEEAPTAMQALFKRANHCLQQAEGSWLCSESLATTTAMFLDTSDLVEYQLDSNGMTVVKEGVFTPDLGDKTKRANLSADLSSIAPDFLDMGKIQVYPLYATAFCVMFTDDYGQWGGMNIDGMLELANKVINNRAVCSQERANQLEHLIVTTQMVNDQEPIRGKRDYHLFHPQIDCAIPTPSTEGRRTRKKKTKDSLMN